MTNLRFPDGFLWGTATAAYQIKRERIGRPLDMADAMIAGICISRGAALATRNIRHFSDLEVELINPWPDSP